MTIYYVDDPENVTIDCDHVISGGGTSTLVFRDINDAKNRISATVDANGNRTAVGTRDAS